MHSADSKEKVIFTVRRTKAKLIKKSILPLILVLLPAFLWYMIFRRGTVSIVVFWSAISIGILWLIAESYTWFNQLMILTDKRLIDIDQQNVFKKEISTISLDTIKDVQVRRKGFWRTISRSGDVIVSLHNSSVRFLFDFIADPQKIHKLIMISVDDVQKNRVSVDAIAEDQLVPLLIQIKKRLGEAGFQKALASMSTSNNEEQNDEREALPDEEN